MSLHDSVCPSSHQGAASPQAMLEEVNELLLHACGLQEAPEADPCHPHAAMPPRRRGRPQVLGWTQLWISLLLCTLQGMSSFAQWRRFLGTTPLGSFAPVWLTRTGLVKRLLKAGLSSLQALWIQLNAQLAQRLPPIQSPTLAPFATSILCLDETHLDAVGRYLAPLRSLKPTDPACFAGKLLGLFDVRSQQWLRLEWRGDVKENCKVDILDFLEDVAQQSLLLFDLGYFCFAFFDTLTQRHLWWISRYREQTSYELVHVMYRQREVLDALVWLGTGNTQARHLVRLIRLGDGVGVRMYLTNVCDPQQLSLAALAELYARRWDIELAFRVLKDDLGLSHWWSSKPELILVQTWVVLILAQVLAALRQQIAQAAKRDLFEVSMPLVIEMTSKHCLTTPVRVETYVRHGEQMGVLRASPRLHLVLPAIDLTCYLPVPAGLIRQRVGRRRTPRSSNPRPKRPRVSGYQAQRERRQASKEARIQRTKQVQGIQQASPARPQTDQLMI